MNEKEVLDLLENVKSGESIMVAGWHSTFLVACFGGLLMELLKWYHLRESSRFPAYSKNPIYWLLTALMVLTGGGLALLYGTEPKSALLVANIGLSAPLIIKALSDSRPSARRGHDTGPGVPGFGMDPGFFRTSVQSVSDFLSWR